MAGCEAGRCLSGLPVTHMTDQVVAASGRWSHTDQDAGALIMIDWFY